MNAPRFRIRQEMAPNFFVEVGRTETLEEARALIMRVAYSSETDESKFEITQNGIVSTCITVRTKEGEAR